MIDEKTPASELDRLRRAGFRGIRLNLATGGQADPATGRRRFQAAIAQVKGLNWHVQMYASLAVIAGVCDLVLASGVPVVFDHFGGTNAALGMDQPGFGDLVDLFEREWLPVQFQDAGEKTRSHVDHRKMVRHN